MAARIYKNTIPHLLQKVGQPLEANMVYIGLCSFVADGSGIRPTQWCNPFSLFEEKYDDAFAEYEDWLFQRMDLEDFVRPLRGRVLVCDCCARRCHGELLVKLCENG